MKLVETLRSIYRIRGPVFLIWGQSFLPRIAMQSLKPLLLIVFALAYATTTSAQPLDNPTKIAPGGISLTVPPIKGFRFPTEQERSVVYAAIAPFILPKFRLLAALLSDADIRLLSAGRIPTLEDYFILQIPRSVEDRVVSLRELQSLRRSMREQQEIQISPTVRRQLAEATEKIAGVKPRVDVTTPIPMGVFEDTERSIGATFLTRYRVEANEARSDELMLSVIAVTVVRGKFLSLNGTCTFHSIADVSRCNSLVKAWLSGLHAANP